MLRIIGLVGWLLLALACWVDGAHATNCGTGTGTCFQLTGNWNTNGTWSDSDGGASCACTPATGDHVLLTANSGAGTINANITVGSLDANGFTNTLTHNSAITLTVNGNDAGAPNGVTFRLSAGMTYTAPSGRLVQFTATSGTSTITTNGKSLGQLTINGAGGSFVLGDDVTSLGAFVLTAGSFDAANFNVTASSFSSNNTNTRAVTMGSGTWTLTATLLSSWDLATTTNLTLISNTSTIVYSATATASRIFHGGGQTYNNLTINNPAPNSQPIIFSGNNTFNNLTFTNVRFVRLGAATIQTITGTLTYDGASNQQGQLVTSEGTAQLVPSNANVLTWLFIQNINENGAGSITCNNCFDGGGNTNITVNAPAGGGGQGIIGGM